ncbi:MAG: PAS domain S-box protein [Bdellovibrionales bacterium]|nr:PAS domain S-box protein [Bdellovibrionales bacterium]
MFRIPRFPGRYGTRPRALVLTAVTYAVGFVLLLAAVQVQLEAPQRTPLFLLLVACAALCAALAPFYVVSSFMRALAACSEAAETVGSSQFASPVAVARDDNLGRLARALVNLHETLRESVVSKSFFQDTLNSMTDMLFVLHANGAIRMSNQAVTEVLGYQREELLGRQFTDFLVDDGAHEQTAFDASTEQSWRAKDGSIVPTSVVTATLREERSIVLVARDSRERKRAELVRRERDQLHGSLQATRQILLVLTHELRTPLAALRLQSELLQASHDQSPVAEQVGTIHEGVVQLSALVNRVFYLAQLATGSLEWRWGEEKLENFLTRVSSDYESRHADGPELVIKRENVSDMLRGDTQALALAFKEILDNVVKHAGVDRLTVWVLSEVVDGSRWLVFRISDRGRGISERLQLRLGHAFGLSSGIAGEQHIEGAGIGLPTAALIAEAHGGSMKVESEESVGTTITIRIRSDLDQPVFQRALPSSGVESVIADRNGVTG